MKMTGLLLVMSLGVSACAQQPENIAAVPVAGDPYKGYSCSRLKQEKLSLNQQLETASAQQRNAATGDAVGVFLLGLPLSSMSGGDRETLIAVVKGRIQAIDRGLAARSCSL